MFTKVFFQSTCQDEMKFSYQLRKCWIYERPMCLVFIHPFFFFFLRHLFGFAISNLAASFSRTTVELQHSDVSWLRVGSGKESVGRIWYTRLFARDLLQITWWYLVRVCHFHFLGHLQGQCRCSTVFLLFLFFQCEWPSMAFSNPPPVPNCPGLASHSRPFALFTRWWQCLWGRRWLYL